MTMSDRNRYQMKLAACYARINGVDILDALQHIARAFGIRYPSQAVTR